MFHWVYQVARHISLHVAWWHVRKPSFYPPKHLCSNFFLCFKRHCVMACYYCLHNCHLAELQLIVVIFARLPPSSDTWRLETLALMWKGILERGEKSRNFISIHPSISWVTNSILLIQRSVLYWVRDLTALLYCADAEV
jgi:hypothetical protein